MLKELLAALGLMSPQPESTTEITINNVLAKCNVCGENAVYVSNNIALCTKHLPKRI